MDQFSEVGEYPPGPTSYKASNHTLFRTSKVGGRASKVHVNKRFLERISLKNRSISLLFPLIQLLCTLQNVGWCFFSAFGILKLFHINMALVELILMNWWSN